MAEILGVVASGIAVGQAAATITGSLLKLKELWSQVRDIPDDLTHLVHEIEIAYLVLAESKEQEQLVDYHMRSRSLEMALQLTDDAAQELIALVDDLRIRVKESQGWKKKLTAAKAVFAWDQIKRYMSRLKRCLRLLTLAQNCKIA